MHLVEALFFGLALDNGESVRAWVNGFAFRFCVTVFLSFSDD